MNPTGRLQRRTKPFTLDRCRVKNCYQKSAESVVCGTCGEYMTVCQQHSGQLVDCQWHQVLPSFRTPTRFKR